MRFLRRYLTRGRVETGLTVTAITLLVWLLAEGRTVAKRRTELQLQLAPPEGQELLIEPSSPVRVEMLYRCATAQQARVEELTQKPLRIEVTPDADDPRRIIVLRDRLASHPALRDLGVEIIRLEPGTIEPRVQRIARVERPITVRTGQLELAEPPAVEPSRATVSVPARLREQAEQARVRVDLTRLDADGVPTGQPQTRQLPVEVTPSLQRATVELTPRTATVRFTLVKRNETLTLNHVPVLMLAPPTALADYRISLENGLRVLPKVKLRGPSDQIERIRRGDFQVWAQFRLTAADISSQVESAPLRLDLPPGVTVAAPDPLPRVQLKIEER